MLPSGKASYFNPRTRVGCDGGVNLMDAAITISIHAPAWGATGPGQAQWHRHIISIHAPAWGATFP